MQIPEAKCESDCRSFAINIERIFRSEHASRRVEVRQANEDENEKSPRPIIHKL